MGTRALRRRYGRSAKSDRYRVKHQADQGAAWRPGQMNRNPVVDAGSYATLEAAERAAVAYRASHPDGVTWVE